MKKRWIPFLLLLLIFSCSTNALAASELTAPESSYTYDYWKNIVSAPVAYTCDQVFDARSVKNRLSSIEDISVSDNGTVFAADKRNNCLYVLSKDLTYIKTMDGYIDSAGKKQPFQAPEGVFAYKDTLYVANTGGANVLVLDQSGNFLNVFQDPGKEVLSSTVDYEPIKVCCDGGGRVYIVARNQNQGIIQLDKSGKFIGYLGANKVVPNAFILFLRSIATDAMIERMVKFIPTEYSNLTTDTQGFVYAVVGAVESSQIYSYIQQRSGIVNLPVRRINPLGNDVLTSKGYYPPVGELQFTLYSGGSNAGPSTFADVAPSANGVYSVLDSRRGKVFTYDGTGNLLYIFGGSGKGREQFVQASSLAYYGDTVYVADKQTGCVKKFEPTAYAKQLLSAISLHATGKYEEETAVWEQINKEYVGTGLAYLGLGKAAYNMGDYRTALKDFEYANDKANYSLALLGLRKEIGAKNLLLIALGLLAAGVGLYYAIRYIKRALVRSRHKALNGIAYAGHVMVHPFDGFWELKFENKGNPVTATILLVLAFLIYAANIRFTPFLFNTANLDKVNIFVNAFSGVVVLVLLWVTASWCLTTLFDGKGSMKNIYIYTCYSLLPYVIFTPVMLVLSQFMSLNEQSLRGALSTLIVVWVAYLLFTGTLTTHQFSLTKNVMMIVLSLVGMGLIIFIGLLCTNLVIQIYDFVASVANEFVMRL